MQSMRCPDCPKEYLKKALQLYREGDNQRGESAALNILGVVALKINDLASARLNLEGAKRVFYATDNFFWLAPGEARDLQIEVSWREPGPHPEVSLTASAWNAPLERCPLPDGEAKAPATR